MRQSEVLTWSRQAESGHTHPFVGTVEQTAENTSGNELPHNPAQVNVGSEDGTTVHARCKISCQFPASKGSGAPRDSQRNGDDLRCVSGCQGLEDTPRDTLKDGSNEKSLNVGSEEGDKNGGDHE